jgi:hypothetical protein
MISSILIRAFSDRGRMAAQPRFSSSGRALSTFSTMCSGCFPSTAPGRPNVFGLTTTSLRTCGTFAAQSSGLNTVFRMQGLILHSNGRNGSAIRPLQRQLLPLRLGRPWRLIYLMTMRLRKVEAVECVQGLPEGPKPDLRPGCGAPGTSPPPPEAGYAAVMAVVELCRMIEADACEMKRRLERKKRKLERISQKLEQISQKLVKLEFSKEN